QALDGTGRPPSELKVLSVMYPNPGMFVVRSDSPHRRIEDLKGKPVAFGTQASGLRILAADVLDGLGMDAEGDFDQRILEKAADGPRLVLEHEVEALWGAGIGWPGFVKIADSPGGARFIAPTHAQIEKILAKHPHLKPMSVPAETYQGQDGQIDSVGLWSLILIRPGLPDSVAYRLASALHEGQELLAKKLKQGQYTTVQNTAAQVPAERLHPGVARYICEAGVSGSPQE
ncbi:MAG: TAXI family TRAP transporter solute-binding subunit, partial [bacterium]|nr:TAXI family TRAP transporter solute-binding subunit [bacterium]